MQIGDKNGTLVVRKLYNEKNASGRYRAMAEVDCLPELGGCGRTGIPMQRSNFKVVHSCGCLRRARQSSSHTRHGLTGTRVYSAWKQAMREDREGRVALQPEWHDLDVFLKEVGPPPEEGRNYRLTRIDKSQGLVKGNVEWKPQRGPESNPRWY